MNAILTIFNVNVKGHQISTAYILKELIYLSELYNKHLWFEQMIVLIREAIHSKKLSYGKTDDTLIQQRFQALLNQWNDHISKKIRTFQKRLTKYKDYLFLFLKNDRVPPDNNASHYCIPLPTLQGKTTIRFFMCSD